MEKPIATEPEIFCYKLSRPLRSEVLVVRRYAIKPSYFFGRNLSPISRATILLTTVSKFIIAGLQTRPRSVASQAAGRGAILTHSAVALSENDPAIFDSEPAGIVGK